MDTCLGIDLGGTKLLIGEVNSDGRVLKSRRYESGYLQQGAAADFLSDKLDDYIRNVGFADGRPAAIGIGVIGRVDSANGIWYQMDSRRNEPVNLAETMSGRFSMPCKVDNDVKSATKAEMLWGAGRISSNFLYLNIGTGIASGAVIDGKLLKGSSFNAGETGHVISGVNLGIGCCCGRKDCAEMIASGAGMDACARLLVGKYHSALTIPEPPARVDTREIIRLCLQSDELCKVLVDNAACAAANLIMDLVRCFDPDCIVLGGGVASEDYIYERILEAVDKYTVRFVSNGIRRTSLNPHYAGLLGAAANAMTGK